MNIIQYALYALFGKSHIDRLEGRLKALQADAEAVALSHLKDAQNLAEHILSLEALRAEVSKDAAKASAVASRVRATIADVI